MSSPKVSAVHEVRSRARGRVALGLAALTLTILTGCGGSPSTAPVANFREGNPDGMHGAVLAQKYVMPDVSLTGTDGRPFSLAKGTTKPLTLVFFGYTRCPDICQAVMADIASALTRLDPADRGKVGVLFVTSDPARDDPQTLRRYLDRFNPDFEGVTGNLKTIVEVGNHLGVAVERGPKLPSGGYEVVHGAQIIGIDEQDRAPIVWTEGTPAGQLAEDLHALLHQQENESSSKS